VCKERSPGRKKVLATSLMHTSFPKVCLLWSLLAS
jgi:hypothetical protein